MSCVDVCKILFLIWETSSKAPFRTYCQYSYALHLFFFSYLGDELKGALSDLLPVLLCSPSFLFFCFSFLFLFLFYFAHIMVFKIPIFYLKGTIQYLNDFLDMIRVFVFHNFLKHLISSVCWSIMRLVPITQGYPKHHQKFSNRSLI